MHAVKAHGSKILKDIHLIVPKLQMCDKLLTYSQTTHITCIVYYSIVFTELFITDNIFMHFGNHVPRYDPDVI